ncbi:MAG: ABC transporter ATP-binding protein [Arenimonas sp.]
MIEAANLRKSYGSLLAVDDLSFKAKPGEVLVFLGPNGAGKSSAMRMISGFLLPSSGSASICGHDVVRESIAAKKCLGYLPEGAPLYGELSTEEFLRFVARARGMDKQAQRSRINITLERLSLKGVAQQTIETLSKGFKRRVGLAAAILHEPSALILDEPTDGLDPNQKHEVRVLIRELAKERTVLLSTHILEEVEAVCTRAIIIAGGRVLADATPAELLAKSRYDRAVSIQVTDSISARAALDGMPGVTGFEQNAVDGRLYIFTKTRARTDEAIAERLRQRMVAFTDLRIERGRLDEVFRSITMPESKA